MKLYKYKVFCETEGKWVYMWKDETETPVEQCPVNTGHIVTAGSLTIAEIRDQDFVLNMAGNPIVEATVRSGKPGSKGVSICTPDWGDRTTWYQKSVQVVDQALSDNGDGMTWNSPNQWWVNIYSKRLTYVHGQIPKRDGSFSSHDAWAVVVKVDGVVQTSGYTVDYDDGRIVFSNSQAGKTVTTTYWHTHNVNNPSEWILMPPVDKTWILEHTEVQVSRSATISDALSFELWAGGTSLASYADFNPAFFAAGYGQYRAHYRGANDYINTGNEGKGFIPHFGDLTEDVLIFPFYYLQAITLMGQVGYCMALRLHLLNNTPIQNAEICTCTFYMQII